MRRIYALYRGEKNVCDGTIDEIAAHEKLKRFTVYWLSTPTAKKRQEKRSNFNGMRLIFIGNE
ncbi:hypothetical protein [Pectinatus haikarae]|uniref:Uncharacterized protein n=1 Tax=Pectinatus haikarae TaxID=349096 RepID=A0ABT9Y8M9_9FIRM|nr:hypothetical protein [Pectinatus haikarae]MDQ0204099.1 hypothetical protein [Pectinatus haikarae]